MAESIIMQLSLAGGAVNLAFNEVLYSYTSPSSNDSYSTANYSVFNTYNWKCALVYNPRCITPFVCFSTYSVFSHSKMPSNGIIGMLPNGNTIILIAKYNESLYCVYGGVSVFLFA